MMRRCLLNCARRSSGLGVGCDLTRLASAGLARPFASALDPAKIQQQSQERVIDPFTSAMQNKTEKELMDQMLRQAEEQEREEDAAEQVTLCSRACV